MKLTKLTQGLLALGLAGASSMALASTPFSTAITPGYVDNQIQLNLRFLTDDTTKLGRYTGPTKEGADATLNLNYLNKDVDAGTFNHTYIKNLGTDTLHFRNRFGKQGDFGIGIEYQERVLNQYQNYGYQLPTLNANQPEIGGYNLDVEHKREAFRLSGQKVIAQNWKAYFNINREDKIGNRPLGSGIWNASGYFYEMAAPVNQRIDTYDLGLEYATRQLQARVSYHLSKFSQLNDNYFMAYNSSLNAATPEAGSFQLAPENSYHRLVGSVGYALSNATRLSAELDYGVALQDDQFITAGLSATEQANLDAIGQDSLDGKYTTTRLGLRASHRLNPGVMLRASYRYDDRDNSTDIHNGLSGVNNAPGVRSTRAHSWTRHTIDADANIRLPLRTNLLVGGKFEDTDRKTSARDETQEATVHARLRSQLTSSLTGGLRVSYGQLTGSEYQDTVTNNHLAVRPLHLADVDKTQGSFNFSWSALDQLALGLEMTYKNFDYANSGLGLSEDERLATTLTADFFPSSTLSGYAFVTLEDGDRTQNGLVQGAASTTVSELTNLTLGLGGKMQLTADGRYKLGADFLIVDSENSPKVQGGTNYSAYKSELLEVRVYGDYQATEQLSFRLSYLMHQYKEEGQEFIYSTNYGEDKYDETVHLVMGTAAYRF